MKFKNKVIQYLKEEEWRSRNTKDIDGLKKIQRELMKNYASGNKEIFRDDAIKTAKETNPDESKKFVRYINRIFENDKRITYKEFVNRMAKQGTIKGNSYNITRPSGYEEIQVLEIVRNIGVNTTPSIKEILLKHYKKEPDATEGILDILKGIGHFEGTGSFFRYNTPNNKWVHISGVQTDIFNRIRKYGAENKKARKVVSEILSKEEDVYKAIMSKVVSENPLAQYFTFSTPELVKKIENIESHSKLKETYEILPNKLGFVKKNLDVKYKEQSTSHFSKFDTKAMGNKNISTILIKLNSNFFKKLYEEEKDWIWFATRRMINESHENNNILLEMAKIDTVNIPEELFKDANMIKIADKYYSNMEERATLQGKSFKKALNSSLGLDKMFADNKTLIKTIESKYGSKFPVLVTSIIFRVLDRKERPVFDSLIEPLSTSETDGSFKFLNSFIKNPELAVYLKKHGISEKRVIFLERKLNKAAKLAGLTIRFLKGDKEAFKKLVSDYPDTFFSRRNDSKSEYLYILNATKYIEDDVLFNQIIDNLFRSMLFFNNFRLTFEEFSKVYLILKGRASKKNIIKLRDLIKKEDIGKIINKFPETLEIFFKSLNSLTDIERILKGVKIIDINLLNSLDIFRDLTTNQKSELLKNSGVSQKEIDELTPNREVSKKEKGFSKKVIGESELYKCVNNLLNDMKNN